MQINHVASIKDKAKSEIKNNNLMATLSSMPPNEVDDYIDDNVTSVQDIKEFLTLLVVAIQALELNK